MPTFDKGSRVWIDYEYTSFTLNSQAFSNGIKNAFIEKRLSRVIFNGPRYYDGFRRRIQDGGQAISFSSLFDTKEDEFSIYDIGGRTVATYYFKQMKVKVNYCTYSKSEIQKISSLDGDLNGDGRVDFDDFLIFAQNFGNTE